MEKGKITCPHCGNQQESEIPTDACMAFAQCDGCGTTIKPKAGDCCVFCSYGDRKCPVGR